MKTTWPALLLEMKETCNEDDDTHARVSSCKKSS